MAMICASLPSSTIRMVVASAFTQGVSRLREVPVNQISLSRSLVGRYTGTEPHVALRCVRRRPNHVRF